MTLVTWERVTYPCSYVINEMRASIKYRMTSDKAACLALRSSCWDCASRQRQRSDQYCQYNK
eukprot:3818011-Amphidinium_carterae.2